MVMDKVLDDDDDDDEEEEEEQEVVMLLFALEMFEVTLGLLIVEAVLLLMTEQ